MKYKVIEQFKGRTTEGIKVFEPETIIELAPPKAERLLEARKIQPYECKTFTTLVMTTFQNITFQGRHYKAGDSLSLSLDQARELLAQTRADCERKLLN